LNAFSIDSIIVNTPSYPARAIEANPGMAGQNGGFAEAPGRTGKAIECEAALSRCVVGEGATVGTIWFPFFERAARGYSSSSA
jgi:hypothetical protein